MDGRIGKNSRLFSGSGRKLYIVSAGIQGRCRRHANLSSTTCDCGWNKWNWGIRSFSSPCVAQLERETRWKAVASPSCRPLTPLIDRFEIHRGQNGRRNASGSSSSSAPPVHPLVLSSPFAHRAFNKPLGYAGDYQMVDMMIRPPMEGNNSILKNHQRLAAGADSGAGAPESRRDISNGGWWKKRCAPNPKAASSSVFNLGCGPADEVQRFFQGQNISKHGGLDAD